MQNDTFRNLWRAIEAASYDITRGCRRVGRAIAVMPWPALLASCIALALLISILPLALFLFILFMGVKVVIGAFIVNGRRADPPEYTAYKD